VPEPVLKCRVCGKKLKAKSAGERVVKGVAGAGVGTMAGAIIGTLFFPGIGTIVGAGLGGLGGTDAGAQNDNLCKSCCGRCKKKRTICICHDVIGRCRSCPSDITRSNSYNGYCDTCRNWAYGDEI
jgi:uncharacterized protein YcfJ